MLKKWFRGVNGIVKANRLNKILPIIEIIKFKQLRQSLDLVKPLSEIPNSPISSKERRARLRENMKTDVIPVITPV
ncbi:MAG: hypothetical protein IJ629_02900 [Clostridia bacterium]|nr:hypothetical protein [Clostridia bacterium]